MLSFFIACYWLVTPPTWHNNFAQAQQIAKANHRLILLNFSGSDWCGPCMLLKRDYFDSAAFETVANKHLVLINADFPRRKKNQLSAEQQKHNDALAEQYNPQGNFPLTLLLDDKGKVIRTWVGKPEENSTDWATNLMTVCAQKLQP